ncbi:MAG: hypothetical protein K8R36_22955, partial [Planctomycetales bacterium]|nr:hypothetical protein [Planctomycetales bacterium]
MDCFVAFGWGPVKGISVNASIVSGKPSPKTLRLQQAILWVPNAIEKENPESQSTKGTAMTMSTEQIDRPARLHVTDNEKNSGTRRRRHELSEQTEKRVERQRHIARCGFEVVSVTVSPHTTIGTCDQSGAAEASEQDRMMSSLVSVLDPEQKVTFIYEGGGRTLLRWSIVGEASSGESVKQAEERLRNVRYALMTFLESQKTRYRFRPISEDAAGQIRAVRDKWIGLIQPQGTHVKHTKGP